MSWVNIFLHWRNILVTELSSVKSIKGQVLDLLRDAGPLPRAELARRLQLSATTITRAVTELEADDVLSEGGALVPAGAGRPGTRLHIQADSCCVASVQIGVGIVHVGIFNALGKRHATTQFEYAADMAPDLVLSHVAQSLKDLLKEFSAGTGLLRGLGVAVPGPVDAAGRRLLVSIRLGWRDVPVADLLEELTGLRVTVEHNVRSMALAEARFGLGRGVGSIAFVYLRSGLGAGLVVRGQPFSGGVHGAIELGHLPVVPKGQVCVCGGTGCIETVLSSTALALQTQRLDIKPEPNALTAIWSASLKRKDAADALDAIVTPLATGLSALMTLLNPERLLLGGALADIPDALFDRIVEATLRGTFPLIRGSIRIERSNLGPDAGLAGAAAVALDHFLYA